MKPPPQDAGLRNNMEDGKGRWKKEARSAGIGVRALLYF
jgi:hypothetical protein